MLYSGKPKSNSREMLAFLWDEVVKSGKVKGWPGLAQAEGADSRQDEINFCIL